MRMNRPTKAVVLAAGFGTRMLPLSRDLPKPLMPLRGVPILERILDLLKRWGVKEVVMLQCSSVAGENYMLTADIVRVAGQKPPLKPWVRTENDKAEGRFVFDEPTRDDRVAVVELDVVLQPAVDQVRHPAARVDLGSDDVLHPAALQDARVLVADGLGPD